MFSLALRRSPAAQPIQPDAIQPDVRTSPIGESRRNYNERYARFRSERNLAVAAMFCSFGLAGIALWGYTSERAEDHVHTQVVVLNRLGGLPIGVFNADEAQPADPRVVASFLSAWATDLRTVGVDAKNMGQNIRDGFMLIDGSGPCFTQMNAILSSNEGNPFERAKRETVAVTVGYPEQQPGDNVWRVQWMEQASNRDGTPAGLPTYWSSTMTLTFKPSKGNPNPKNPLGMYIETCPVTQQPGVIPLNLTGEPR